MKYAFTPGQLALLASGLDERTAAKRARIQVPYLRRLLRDGAPHCTAVRLAAVLCCSIDVFLTPGGGARRSVLATGGRAMAKRRGPLAGGVR